MINLSTISAAAVFLLVSHCMASENWAQLTSPSKLTCEIAKPCLVKQPQGHPEFEIVLRSTSPNESNMVWVEEFQIKDVSNGKTSTVRLSDNDGVDTSSEVPLFSHDINGDGFTDLALEKGSFNKGQAFFYWIYNPAEKKFVFQGNENIPELEKVKGSNDVFESTTSYEKFKIDSAYRFTIQP